MCMPLKWSMLYWVDWGTDGGTDGRTDGQTDAESAAHTGTHTLAITINADSDLIVLSVLDAAQSRHPLLHLLPVVCAQNQPSAGGDNLSTHTETQNKHTPNHKHR